MKKSLCFVLYLLILVLLSPGSVFSDSVIMTVTVSTTTGGESGGSGSGGGGTNNTGGGGGGGGFLVPQTILTQAIFKGRAYPGSLVSLTRDGSLIATAPAGPDAFFEISAANLHTGTYTFGITVKDKDGVKSLLQTFTLSVTEGASTIVSGIFIPPTISVDNKQIKKGEILTILGQTAPNAQVTLFVNSQNELIDNVPSDVNGIWFYKLNTALLEYGNHTTKALAKKDFDVTSLSTLLSFKVGTVTIQSDKVYTSLVVDVNGDGRVNLIDFSIEAFWYKKSLSSDIAKKVDFNNDGKVDLIDFSIMAYHWTG